MSGTGGVSLEKRIEQIIIRDTDHFPYVLACLLTC